MKIKTKAMSYDEVMALPKKEHKKPVRPSRLLAGVIRLATAGDLRDVNFTWTETGMDGLEQIPCLILMNHSSFVDLEIAARIFRKRPYNIICTSDGFVGKEGLMRQVGCIPTQKFVRDITLIQDMEYTLHTLKSSVLMYPEASYTFDGCATPLPRKLGVLLKKLNVPVIGVKTFGAFSRDPLYNCLQKRKVSVRAEVSCLVRAEELKERSVRELDERLDEFFTFDGFRWQQENEVRIEEPFRADGLNRILYKCPGCGREGGMQGSGIHITCGHCRARQELSPFGRLVSEKKPVFDHIPDWYRWEREQVRQELQEGSYRLDIPVEIGIMVDYKAIYMVGEGRLEHSSEGFHLTGCGGKLDYTQSPLACYSLYSDYFWYELGDMICIGSNDVLYYCFPKGCGDVVAKTRLAAEELYKMKQAERKLRPAIATKEVTG